jgi:hypothetical protein
MTTRTADVAGTRRTGRTVVAGVVAVVLVLLAVNAVAWILDRAVGGNAPEGRPGSSYSTTSEGVAAYAQLLSDYGHPVRRVRGALADADLDPAATLIVTSGRGDAFLEPEDLDAVARFLGAGGRVVLVGLRAVDVAAITGVEVDIADGASPFTRFGSELEGLVEVRTDGTSSYVDDGTLLPLAWEGRRVLLGSAMLDSGQAWILADGSPIENARIAQADNAAFAITLAGAAEAPVAFAEGVHGYGEQRGIAALPTEWKVALIALAAAGVLFAWSRARRLGPPDRPARDLPPARSVYVDAMARTLAATSDSVAALAPLGAWARDRIRQRAGLAADADREAVETAAHELGLGDDERESLWRPPRSREDVLALGRVVARLTDERMTE